MAISPSARSRAPITPPSRNEVFQRLDRPAKARRVKTGRTEQLNVRVKAGFKERIQDLAAREKETLGSMLEAMAAAYEAGAATPVRGMPIAEARAGRTKPLHLWATDEVFATIGKVAALRKLTASGLIEDLLSREVARLDPHGGKFGVHVER